MFELKRVLFSKPVVGALVILIILNVFYYFKYEKNSDEYIAAYNEIIENCQGKNSDETEEYLSSLRQSNRAVILANNWELYEVDTKAEYIDSLYAAYDDETVSAIVSGTYIVSEEEYNRAWESNDAIAAMSSQLEHLDSFSNYYDSIVQNAQSMGMFSIFSDPNSFAYKNIQKTVEDFECIKNVQVTLDNELAINSVFSGKLADYSVFAFMLVAALMFIVERRNGLWELIYSSKNGRGIMILNRVLVLLVCSFVSVTLLVGGRFALACLLNGGAGDLSRAVQSNSLFGGIAQNISMGGFLIEYYVFKIVGMWLAGMAVWLILLLFSNTNAAIAVSSVFIALEYVLFTTIPDSYSLVVLRFVNIFAFVDFERIFGAYLNIDLFGNVVNGSAITIALIPVAAILLIGGCVACGCFKKPITSPSIFTRLFDKLQKFYDKMVSRLGLFGNEMHKILIHQKVLVLIVFLLLWATFFAAVPVPDGGYDAAEAYNKSLYEGAVSQKMLEEIDSEIDSLLSLSIRSQYEETKLAALQGIRFEAEMLLSKGEADGISYYLIDSSVYDALVSEDANDSALIALLFVVLMFAGIFAYENKNNTKAILRSSENGMNKIWRVKAGAAILLTTFIWAVIYGTQIVLCSFTYGGLHTLNVPIGSFLEMTSLPSSMTAGTWLVLIYLLRLLIMYSLTGATVFISGLLKNVNLATIVCCAVLILPALLFAIVGNGAIKITFADALVYGNDYMSKSNLILNTSLLAAGVLSFAGSFVAWKQHKV